MLALRDYQEAAKADALAFFKGAKRGDRRLYSSPTGTGKSVIELAVAQAVDAWIVTPKIEIIKGMLEKLGICTDGWDEGSLLEVAWALKISTPVRLRNRLAAGPLGIKALVVDEAHHDTASTYQEIALLTARCPAVGYTATAFRGTADGTRALREAWGEPVAVLTWREAADLGHINVPSMRTVPLTDDDLAEVRGGELVARDLEEQLLPVIDDAARLLIGHEDMPTMVAVPTCACAQAFYEACCDIRIATDVVVGTTPFAARQRAFEQCLACRSVLVQIAVVSEGVDLPVRRLVDLSPTLSPVRWVQQLGRITRPGSRAEYVCANRNLMRHAYALDGVVPRKAVLEAQEAYGGESRYAGRRAIGLETLGRLRPSELRLRDGMVAHMYCIERLEGLYTHEYVVFLHPVLAPMWAERVRRKGTGEYGRWQRCEAPETTGFASAPARRISEKQAAWWRRSAGHFGLDPETEPTTRTFAALPALVDTRYKL